MPRPRRTRTAPGTAPAPVTLSELDQRIIDALIRNPLESAKTLSEQLNAPAAAIGRRINALIDEQVISVTVQQDFEATGAHFLVHVDLFLAHGYTEKVAQELSKLDEVTSCAVTLARPEVIVRLALENQQAYATFVREKLSRIKGIEHIEALTVLEVEKYSLKYGVIER